MSALEKVIELAGHLNDEERKTLISVLLKTTPPSQPQTARELLKFLEGKKNVNRIPRSTEDVEQEIRDNRNAWD